MSGGDTLYILPGTYDEGIGGTRTNTDKSCTTANGGRICIPDGTPSQHTIISAAPGYERQARIHSVAAVNMQGPFNYITFYGLVMDSDRAGLGSDSASVPLGGGCYYDGDYQCKMARGTDPAYPTNIVAENNEIKNGARFCIQGLGSDDRYGSSADWIGIYPPPANNIFRNNDIHDCGTNPGLEHAIYQGGDTLVENNRIWHAAGFGIQFQGVFYANRNSIARGNLIWDSGFGMVVEGAGNVGNFAYNNVIFKTGSTYCDPYLQAQGVRCIYGTVGPNDGGIMVAYGGNHLIANNTIVGVNFGVQDGPYADTTKYYNNVCVACTGNVPPGQPGSISGAMWFVSGGQVQGSTYINNPAVSSTSVFVDAANKNFQLASGTGPLTNTGTNAPNSTFTTDANGAGRPQGSAWDVGACEWFSGATACPNFRGTTAPAMAN